MSIQADTGIWSIGDNWPWPQIIFTKYFIFGIAQKSDGKLALYEMTNENNVWSATEKINLGIADNVQSVSIADFFTYYILTVHRITNDNNDKIILQKNVSDGTVNYISPDIFPSATTCCDFLGQLILGGLQSDRAPWVTLTACSVAWSDIGSTEMNPENRVVAGYAVMPWNDDGKGEVWKVLPIKNIVRVYGDQGICDLTSYNVGKVTGFGVGELETPGILSSDAVDGNEKIHGYVDTNYDWWIYDGDTPVNLGYRNFMETLTNRIVVSYDSHNKRFYISDGVLGYVYTKHGMYSSHQCMSSVGNYKGILCGFFKNNADTKIRIASNPIDFGVQGNTTIESIEAGVSYDDSSEVMTSSIALNYGYNEDYIQLAYTQLNPRGISTQKATAREFKIYLQSNYVAGTEFSLSSLKVKIKFSDKRNIRGRLHVS